MQGVLFYNFLMPELIWTGKYDERDKKVAPLKVSLPFQTIETVNESNNERTIQLVRQRHRANRNAVALPQSAAKRFQQIAAERL